MNLRKKGSSVNRFKEFSYAFKSIYRIDKLFVYQKICATILASIQPFAYAYIIRTAVAAIENNQPYNIMIINILLVSGIAFLISFASRLLEPVFWYKSNRIALTLRHQKSIRTLDLDYELMERPETLDAAEKATRNLSAWNGVMGLFNNTFLFFSFLLSLLIASAIILTVNPLLILAVFLLAIIKIILENKNQRREKKEFSDKHPPLWRRINYTNNIATNLTIGKDLRIFNMDDFINHERTLATDEYINLFIKNQKKNIFYNILINFIALFDTFFLYGFMIYEVLYNNMNIAVFTFMVSSVFTLTNSLLVTIRQNAYILRNALQTKDYREFMEISFIRTDEIETIEANEVEIEFRNVYYSYYLQDGYALENVSFKIKRGEKIALVGYNGAGKTTIVKLLSGLYHPTKGKILINGHDIETLTRESLQRLISLVFQDYIMYPLEVAENIAMDTTENVDYYKIKDIIKLLELEQRIEKLPHQLKTSITRELDETGIELSGGENQKIALARAMYKNAPLYVLDEPTSSMDALGEIHMYHRFNEIIKGNTALFISHRLSSTKFCDRIFFISEGQIKEMGTHKQLMELDGEYKKLFSTQANYYMEDNYDGI